MKAGAPRSCRADGSEHVSLLGALIKAVRSSLGNDLSQNSSCSVLMPVQFPLLQLLTRVFREMSLHRRTAASGMENDSQGSAHLLHPKAAKNQLAGSLDQK